MGRLRPSRNSLVFLEAVKPAMTDKHCEGRIVAARNQVLLLLALLFLNAHAAYL